MLRVLFVNLEQTRERPRSVRLHSRKHVLIDGHRERGIGVPQPFAHHLHRHAGLQQQVGVGVAKIVKANLREGRLCDETLERLPEVVGMERGVVRVSEDEIALRVDRVEPQAFLGLLALPSPQHCDDRFVKVDRSSTSPGLHVGELDLVLDRNKCLVHGEARSGEVDVAPAQSEHLATTHPRVRREEPRRVEPVLDAESLGGSASTATLRETVPFRAASASALRRIEWM